MSIREISRVIFCWLLSVVGLAIPLGSNAAPLQLANSPLFLGVRVDPNVFFMVDDSGSMDWEILATLFIDKWLITFLQKLQTSS